MEVTELSLSKLDREAAKSFLKTAKNEIKRKNYYLQPYKYYNGIRYRAVDLLLYLDITDVKDIWNRTFFKYLLKTPWAGSMAVQHVYDEMAKIYNDQRDTMIRLVNLLATNQRAFCVPPKYTDQVKKVFSVTLSSTC